MAGALADALGSVPEQLVGAVDQAKKLTDSINGIQDAAAEREKAAAERDLATAKARIELLGLNATEEDAAALARAEQAVKLRTATRRWPLARMPSRTSRPSWTGSRRRTTLKRFARSGDMSGYQRDSPQ